MKVQIEKTISDIEDCLRLNHIIKICLEYNFIYECNERLNEIFKDNNKFIFGTGGSHLWVSYKFNNKKIERVLFVTEE